MAEALGNIVDVIGDAAQDFAARLPVEKNEWKTIQLAFHFQAQVIDGPLYSVYDSRAATT